MGVTVPDELAGAFNGSLVAPGDAGYDLARAVHNGLIDKRPGLIARCHNVADVRDAVNFGRDTGLEISVRGGGHNVAGRAVTEGGLMIDLALMRGVDVDPARRRARVQGGATWNEYNRATGVYGQATTGGVVSTTGVSGLTLGGGLGWLMGVHGLAIDNVTQIEIVTADGQVRIVNADVEPDLFWALRGGGGNFGVAASFEFQTHPLDVILGGLRRPPAGRRARGLRPVPAVHQGAARRGDGLLRAHPRPGRQRDEAVCPPAVPRRRPGEGRGRPGAAARLRASRVGPRRGDAVPHGQLDARCRLPTRSAELLEGRLLHRAERCGGADDGRRVRGGTVDHERHGRRALPWRDVPGLTDGDGLPAPGAGLQPGPDRPVARPGRDRGQRGVGAGDLCRAGAVHGAEELRELPRRRRGGPASPTPTGRTWPGWWRSSGATTRTTSSG